MDLIEMEFLFTNMNRVPSNYMNGIRTNPEKNWYTDAYGTLYEDWNNSPQPANQCHVCCNTLAMVKDEVASLQYEVEKLKKTKVI